MNNNLKIIVLSLMLLSICNYTYSENKIRLPQKMTDSKSEQLVFYTYRNGNLYVNGNVSFYYLFRPSEIRAEFYISNPTKEPIDFKDAEYYAIYEDNAIYYFEFDKVEYNDGVRHSTILNPNHTIMVYCACPVFLDYSKVKDIYIKLVNGEKLHFVPYEQLDEYLKSPKRYWENLIGKLKKI